MSHKRSSSVVALALLFALVAAPKPTAAVLSAAPLLAQSALPTPFPLPDTVAEGTTVRIDGSNSMAAVNQSLKQQFEEQYAGTRVEESYNGTTAALQSLRDGAVDLAAIGRPLTAAEKAEGLTEVPVGRSKIAIIVGEENPFTGDLTFEQFAQIFRGEVTDWSEVGGTPGPIRLIDQPKDSDTRQAFRNYPVFQAAPFEAGLTALPLVEDSADAIVSELGSDGIGYVTANQVVDRPGVRMVPMHQTLPTDPRYPYSQPLVYVYRGEASPAVAAFLGFATAPTGQAAIAGAGAAIVANAGSSASSPATDAPEAVTPPNPGAVPPDAPEGSSPETAPPATSPERRATPWLWLLPLLLGIPLLWWLLGRRRGAAPGMTPGGTPGSISGEDLPVAVPPVAAPSPDRTSIADVRPSVGGAVLAGGAALAGGAVLGDGRHRPLPNRIILTPRTTNYAYAYWEIPEVNQETLRQQGGKDYTLKVYDVTGIDLEQQAPHSIQELDCAEADQDRFVPNLQSDRDYIAEIGYRTGDNRWLSLARSERIRMPSNNPLPDEANVGIASAVAPLATVGTAVAGAAWLNAVAADEIHRPNQITLSPRDPQQAYAYWNVPEENKAMARRWGGRHYTLRVCDVTGIDLERRTPLGIQQFACQESDSERLVPILQSDRDYVAEIGYLTDDDQWLMLARSAPVRVARVSTESASDSLMPDLSMPDLSMTEVPMIAEGQQEVVEAAKYNVGQPALTDLRGEELADVDANLPPLGDGYGDSQIFLLPRDPNWAYTYWDVPNSHKEALRREGGARLALRFYDVTGVNLDQQRPHSLQQYDCDELARDWYLPVPVSDRDYIVEIGYLTSDGRWLMLARSNPARIPPIYPSGWLDDQFVTVDWEEDLRGKTQLELPQPVTPSYGDPMYDRIFNLVKVAEAQRVAGSIFGSMQQVPEQALSSYSVSGLGLLARTESGVGMMSGAGIAGMSGVGMSGVGVTGMSGVGMSGVGLSEIGITGMSGVSIASMSGVGMSGVGMSGIGITAMSGVGITGMSGVGAVGMSGIGMVSGVGVVSMSGIGAMSGVGITGMSGVGMSGIGMSGVGMMSIPTMSGVGMSGVGMMSIPTMSGVGMSGVGMMSIPTMSGVGMSGVGMMSIPTMSGVGMSGVGMMSIPTMSGVGMSGVGMGLTMSGIGLSGVGLSGVGMMSIPTMSGVGMSGVGMGLTMSGVGMSGVGMYSVPTMSGVGMSGVGMGLTMSGVGMSGVGMMSIPTMSGVGMSGVGMGLTMSGVGMSGVGMGLTMSGVGMSGVGMGLTMSGVGMSGVGFAASMPPIRPRKFWLVANAELIVHGATEPDATVKVGDREIKLSPDGTFRFQVAFPDGEINYPILAVAADGEQTRSVRMDFNRETPVNNGNTREQAVEEWLHQ